MEQFRADLASWLVSLGAGKLSHEFFNLVNAIGSAKSKQEEALIIKKESELLQQTINKPENLKMMREFLIRGLYCEMLGHPVPFVYIHALNMTQSPRLLDKRVGYLCTASFLNDDHELLLLLLNSVRKDLDSTNILEVSAALSCMGWLLNRDTVYAILPLILEKCKSPNELVRKKAVMLLLRCLQKDVAATWGEIENVLRSRLCDSDPSVMAATLHCFLYVLELKHSDPVTYASLPNLVDLVPSFVGILKQLVERRLPSHYNYHQVHAPWIQISLLRLLRYLGMADPSSITHMSQVLKLILTSPADRMAACAIVNEVIHTICSFSSPDKQLLDLCARNITLFLGATSQDLNYLGLKLLAKIVTINPAYATEHQAHVISCLESPDETIRAKTIELLFHMTNSKNLFVIVGKMLERLKKTTDIFIRTEVVNKITTLAEKYSTDNFWFINTVNDVFLTAGDQVPVEVAYRFLRYIAEGATDDEDINIDLRLHAVNAYMQLSTNPQLSDILQMVMAWVIGEYGYLVANPMEAVDALADLLERTPALKSSNSSRAATLAPIGASRASGYQNIDSFAAYYGSDVKQWIVLALTKLASSVGIFPLHVREAFVKLSGSDNTELARRCQETLLLLDRIAGGLSVPSTASSSPLISLDGGLLSQPARSGSAQSILAEIFPSDAAAEDLLPSAVLGASLNAYVKNALNSGARPYSRPVERTLLQTTTPKEEKALRWKAYERPTEVPRFNPNLTSPMSGGGGIGALGTPQAPYNPLMTTVPATSGSSPVPHPGPQAPSTPTSLAGMATRSGPWSSGGFARAPAAAVPYTPPAHAAPTSMSSNPSHQTLGSHTAINNGTPTRQELSSFTDTYRPKLDANQARLANALFSGVGDSSSPASGYNGSPTSTNVHQTARNRLSGQVAGSHTRTTVRSGSNPSLGQASLIDLPMDGQSTSGTPQNQNSHDLLGLSFNGMTTAPQSQLSHPTNQQASTTSPLGTTHSLLGPDLLSGAPASPSASSLVGPVEVDLLGGSVGSLSVGSSSSLLGSGSRRSPSMSPSSSQQSIHDVMQFTDSSNGGGNPNGGQLKQLTIDKDNWNLSNFSRSHLVSSMLEPFPKPSQSSQMLSNDPFLSISVIKAWTKDGLNIGIFFGNRTSLKLSNISTILQLSAPVSMQIEADHSMRVDFMSEKEVEIATKEISAHFAAVAVIRLKVEDRVSLNMSVSGATTFEVHNQPKSVKYRIPIDFRDFVRSLPVPIEQFGAAWNAPEMREIKIRSPLGNFAMTNDLATVVAGHNFGIVQAGKAEIVAACALCFDASNPQETPAAACLLHIKLDATARTIDFTFKSESQSFAEIASRYFSSIFG
jgi:hypothetical protein